MTVPPLKIQNKKDRELLSKTPLNTLASTRTSAQVVGY